MTHMHGVPGLDIAGVTAWLHANVADAVPPFVFEVVAGGRSNLTYAITDAEGRRLVLRRPPLGHVLATAHDMAREARVQAALAAAGFPVPEIAGLCTDETVIGVPFYVMPFVEGHVLHDEATAQRVLDDDGRRRAGFELVDTLARLHALDPDTVGLGDLGRRGDYAARQLRRWQRQFEASKTRDIPLVGEVHEHLWAMVPEEVETTIVHGDYRLDNCVVDEEGALRAVLDWELCTLGDPLADLAMLVVYWGEPGRGSLALPSTPTSAAGFPSPAEVVERYGAVSGRDLGGLRFHVALACWKLACISEGVYSRALAGSVVQQIEDVADVAPRLATRAAEVLASPVLVLAS